MSSDMRRITEEDIATLPEPAQQFLAKAKKYADADGVFDPREMIIDGLREEEFFELLTLALAGIIEPVDETMKTYRLGKVQP